MYSTKDYVFFLEACRGGNLETAKEIYSRGGIDVKGRHYNNAPFNNACIWGNVNIAQWLYNIDPTVFTIYIEQHHFHPLWTPISDWLQKIGYCSCRQSSCRNTRKNKMFTRRVLQKRAYYCSQLAGTTRKTPQRSDS